MSHVMVTAAFSFLPPCPPRIPSRRPSGCSQNSFHTQNTLTTSSRREHVTYYAYQCHIINHTPCWYVLPATLRVNDCSSTLRMDSQWPPSSSAIANTIPILNKVVNRSGVQRWIIQHWMRHPLLFPLRTGWMTALRRYSDSHFEQGG